MNKAQALIQNKQGMLIMVLVVIQVFLTFGVILPAYEKIPYFESKVEQLRDKTNMLEINSLHIQYYKSREALVQSELNEFVSKIKQLHDPSHIQKQLSKLQQNHQLDVVSQKTDSKRNRSDFSQVTISQTLTGQYQNHVDYLDEITRSFHFALISDCGLTNNSPLNADPLITMNLKIILFRLEL